MSNFLDFKRATLQGKPIERTEFVRFPPSPTPPKRQTLLRYGSRFWYLKLWEELIKLAAAPERLEQGTSVCFCNDNLFAIIAFLRMMFYAV